MVTLPLFSRKIYSRVLTSKAKDFLTPLLCSYSAPRSGTYPTATETFTTANGTYPTAIGTSTADTGTIANGTSTADTGTSTAASPTSTNDPPAGSPTETLLRLLLPLSDQVHPTST